jgi:hypothetical protein
MKQLPIWRDANRLLLEVEQAVRGFSRYHKYSVGTDLRRQSMGIVRLLSRAYHAEGDRRGQVRRLVFAVDDIKVLIQLAKELQAFASFSQFQRISALAVSVGRQSGSWLKKV